MQKTFYFCAGVGPVRTRARRILLGRPLGCCHVLNRWNARTEVFHKNADYVEFLKVLGKANGWTSVRLLAVALAQQFGERLRWTLSRTEVE